MEFVTLVNRTSKFLNGTWNGKQFKVAPGPQTFPMRTAQAIKAQNPKMGTQGSEIFDVEYLCGIKELGDDVSPTEQSDAKELMNSKVLHGNKRMMEVQGETSMYRTRQSVAADLPNMNVAGFEKP